MDLLKILKSLEEFLFEAISWLVFFPRTLWRIVRHPIQMADYAEREIHDKLEDQFSDSVSPPLFLMLCVLVAHLLELNAHALMPIAQNALGRVLESSEQNLLLYRSVTFAVWSLIAATTFLREARRKLERASLRAPFFAQCYITAPFAMAFSGSTVFLRGADEHLVIGNAILLGAVTWYVLVQGRWFAEALRIRRALGVWLAFRSFLLGLAINVAVAFAVLGF